MILAFCFILFDTVESIDVGTYVVFSLLSRVDLRNIYRILCLVMQTLLDCESIFVSNCARNVLCFRVLVWESLRIVEKVEIKVNN